ncbi:MAG: hypothetical protein Kow00107_07670 [Planctomycetota bacterium]
MKNVLRISVRVALVGYYQNIALGHGLVRAGKKETYAPVTVLDFEAALGEIRGLPRVVVQQCYISALREPPGQEKAHGSRTCDDNSVTAIFIGFQGVYSH